MQAPAAPATAATVADPERVKQLSQAVAERVRSLAELSKVQECFFKPTVKPKINYVKLKEIHIVHIFRKVIFVSLYLT